MPTLVVCPSCRKKMGARDADRGRVVKCSGCGALATVPGAAFQGYEKGKSTWGRSMPAESGLEAPLDFTAADQAAEHLRVIRLYLGWLLVFAAVPAVLWLAAAALWVASRFAAAGASAGP